MLAACVLALVPAAGEEEAETPDPAAGWPGEAAVVHLPALEAGAESVPPQTLTVEQRDGWVVVSLRVDPHGTGGDAGDEEGEADGGGAFADSAETTGAMGSGVAAAEAAEGGLEWAVVLCEAEEGVTPVIAPAPEFPGVGTLPLVGVTYGRYFVRDTVGALRVLRQPKVTLADIALAQRAAKEDGGEEGEKDRGTAPPGWALPDPPTAGGPARYTAAGAIGLRVVGAEASGWQWACVQPAVQGVTPDGPDAPADVIVRMAPADLAAGMGAGSVGFTVARFTPLGSGEDLGLRLTDEGDLLTADRMPLYRHAAALAAEEAADAREKARARLAYRQAERDAAENPAPPLDARLFDAEADSRRGPDVDLAARRGKVVLLDFWATWCGPCKQKMPAVKVLMDEYGGDGLEVLAVHAPRGADDLPEYMKDAPPGVRVAVATEAAMGAFGVSFLPTYVLVDRDGTIRREPSSTVPTAKEIEAALARPAGGEEK